MPLHLTNSGSQSLSGTLTLTNSLSSPLVIQGVVGSSANLTEWRDSTGAIVACIEADGTLYFAQSGTVWEDLRFPAQAINPAGAASPPAISNVTGMLEFSGSVDNVIAGQAQMPHNWRYGSPIYPHIHLVFPTNNTLNSRWKFEYNIIPLQGTAVNVYGNYTDGGTLSAANPNVPSAARISGWTPIDMTGNLGSCTVLWKISRLASSDAADNDTSVVVLTEFDIHYECDKIGSRAELPV